MGAILNFSDAMGLVRSWVFSLTLSPFCGFMRKLRLRSSNMIVLCLVHCANLPQITPSGFTCKNKTSVYWNNLDIHVHVLHTVPFLFMYRNITSKLPLLLVAQSCVYSTCIRYIFLQGIPVHARVINVYMYMYIYHQPGNVRLREIYSRVVSPSNTTFLFISQFKKCITGVHVFSNLLTRLRDQNIYLLISEQ